jgi:hypothetical protein
MRRSLVLFGIVAGLAPASAFAQATPSGSADYTNIVRSNSVGMPGQTTNPADQLTQRQGLQDLSTDRGGKNTSDKARPARKDELTVGAIVNDKTGIAIAKIEQVDLDGVVVSMGAAKVKVPAEAFGHNKAGLLLDMTKAQFEQVVAQAK